MTSLLLRGGRIVRSTGMEQRDIFIEDGALKMEDARRKTEGTEVLDVSGKLLFPGLIDCHVHFREPGLTEKGDMRSESRAALAGGVTTVCDMPNTIPPTVTVAALADKVRRAHAIKDCDLRFFFGCTEPQHLLALRNIWLGGNAELRNLRSRCVGVKIFFDHSTGNQKISENLLGELFALCGTLKIPIVGHCEDVDMNAAASSLLRDSTNIADHSHMRPPESEAAAIGKAIDLARTHKTTFHVAHLSTAQGLGLVRQAKRERLPVTCEVAPHHLFLTVDDYKALGTLGKMNPPLREAMHHDALWEGIADGTVDCIATDHAPHTLEEKRPRGAAVATAQPSGVPGVETMLPLLLTVAAGKWPHPKAPRPSIRVFEYSSIRKLCFDNPSRIFNLKKNGIVEGAPADIVIVDPEKEWIFEGKNLHSKCGWTSYEGWRVTGRVERTLS